MDHQQPDRTEPAEQRLAWARLDFDRAEAAIAVEKLQAFIDPDCPRLTAFVGNCISCGNPENYTYCVPERDWREIVPRQWWNQIVCAGCFHELARKATLELDPNMEAVLELRCAGCLKYLGDNNAIIASGPHAGARPTDTKVFCYETKKKESVFAIELARPKPAH